MRVRDGLLALFLLAAPALSQAPSGHPPARTVATLPAPDPSVITGFVREFFVTDGADASDCTVGSGSTRVLCFDNGTEWVAVSGGGGSGDVTAVGECTTGACFSGQTMVTSTTAPGGDLSGLFSALVVADDSHSHGTSTVGGLDAANDVSTGVLAHERGGLEADVSAFSGLLRIASGATTAVTNLAGLNTALGSSIADGPHTTDTDDQIASEVPYTPANGASWVNPDPTEAADALDDLAARLTTEEAKADDDVPESGDFGAAVDLEADGSLSADVVAAAEMADADHGDVTWSAGVASVEDDSHAHGASTISGLDAGDTTTGAFADARIDGSTEADELVLVGDVDGAANVNDLDEANVEVELEGVLDHNDLQGYEANRHVDHTAVTLTAGAGLSGGGDISASRSFATASQEAAFLADGGVTSLTCGSSAEGKAQVLDSGAIEYCDGATTSVLRTGFLDADGVDDDVPDAGEVDDTALAAGAVDGGNLGEIADGSVTADDLGTDSVSADELNATGVETELEAVLEVGQLQGGLAADQVDTITDIAAALKSGTDAELVTGTLATTSAVVTVDANDDLVEQGLTYNITAATCTGDGGGGALTVNGSNQIVCSADDGGGAGGDNVSVNGTPAADANLEDSSDVTWTLDGGATPDDINAAVVDDSHAHTGTTISTLDAGDTTTGTFIDARVDGSLEGDETWRTHATDCTALADGVADEYCLELDSERTFSCQPTAGGCDTAAEWIATTIDAAHLTTGTLADARVDGSVEADEVNPTLGTQTQGNYVATIADDGQSTITVNNSGSETAAVTLRVVDVVCTDCLSTAEIADSYVLNAGDTITGDLNFSDGTGDSPKATFTPQTGTAFSVFALDASDELKVEANAVTSHVVTLENVGAGSLGLDVEGPVTVGGIFTAALESASLTALLDDELLVGTGAAAGAFTALQNCDDTTGKLDWTGTAFACVTDQTGAGGGDAIRIEDGDNGNTFTAATDPDFDDSGDINFALDTGATPDSITATVRADSVALTTDTTGSYAAGDAEAGAALTGDSATAFFSAGTIEDARIDGSAESGEVDHNATANYVADQHVAHTGVTLTAGAGLSGGGDISASRSLATASGEADFLASGALTCGASTQGKAQVHTTPLQYCDNAATPALQYAAYGDSSGNSTAAGNDSVALTTDTTGNYAAGDGEAGAALTGDSATSFFSTGEIADAQISDTLTASTSTTAAANDSDTSISTTAFVQQEINGAGGRSLTCASGSCDVDQEAYEHTKCINIDPTHSTTDWLFFRAERAITLIGIDCIVDAATSVVLTLRECNSNAASCTDSEAAITCAATNTTEATSIDDTAVDAGDWMRVTRGTRTGTPLQASLCVVFTIAD